MPVALAGDGIPVTSMSVLRTPAADSGPYVIGGNTIRYGVGTNVRMVSVVVGGMTLTRSTISNPTITIRRIDNAQSSGQRHTLFYAGRVSGSNIFIEGEEVANMEQALNNDFLTSSGLDVFLNVVVGSEQANNIERVDYIVGAGILLPTTASLLGEIGTIANEKHGNNTYKIAMITSLDAFGAPASYGPLAIVEGGVDYGNLGQPTNAGGSFRRNIYMRNDPHPTGASNGPVGFDGSDSNFIGLSFVSFAAMGATPGQTIYGYSIFPNDMFDASDLVGLTDAPLNTGTAINGGDIFGGTFAVFTTPAAELEAEVVETPNLVASKSVEIFDPLSEGLYAVPGNDVVYTIALSNTGAGSPDADTIFIADRLPTEVEFYFGDIDDAGPETNPIAFVDASSGLTFSYGSDSGYSNSVTSPSTLGDCTYTPVLGYDPAVTHICFAPSGTLAIGAPVSGFSVKFRARIK